MRLIDVNNIRQLTKLLQLAFYVHCDNTVIFNNQDLCFFHGAKSLVYMRGANSRFLACIFNGLRAKSMHDSVSKSTHYQIPQTVVKRWCNRPTQSYFSRVDMKTRLSGMGLWGWGYGDGVMGMEMGWDGVWVLYLDKVLIFQK